MKQLITYLLLAGLLLGMSGCRLNDVEYLNGIVADIGSSQITNDEDLIGERLLTNNGDSYTGVYTADLSLVTGREVVFGGASIYNRELFLSGTIKTESGKATVRIRMNDEVIELEPDADGHYETTLKLDNGGNYMMVVYEGFSGSLETKCEYLDDAE